MNLQHANYSFKSILTKRASTKYLFLHHAAASNCSVLDVHKWHLNNGWLGIGYHFFVRKDGSIWKGRNIDTIGAHAGSYYNPISIAICFEGNFDVEEMNTAQFNAGQECIKYILEKYPKLEIVAHRDKNATACPGKNFPFEKMKDIKSTSTPTPTPTGTLYRVQVGAFGDKGNAQSMATTLKALGYDTYLVQTGALYKVQTGAFSIKSNADTLEAELKRKGFETYITTNAEIKSIETLALEVIEGKWGNGTEREQRLTEAGYNYDLVQAEVNKYF